MNCTQAGKQQLSANRKSGPVPSFNCSGQDNSVSVCVCVCVGGGGGGGPQLHLYPLPAKHNLLTHANTGAHKDTRERTHKHSTVPTWWMCNDTMVPSWIGRQVLTRTHTHIQTQACTHIHTNTRTHAHTRTHTHTHTHTHIYTNTHTHAYTHTHTS